MMCFFGGDLKCLLYQFYFKIAEFSLSLYILRPFRDCRPCWFECEHYPDREATLNMIERDDKQCATIFCVLDWTRYELKTIQKSYCIENMRKNLYTVLLSQ